MTASGATAGSKRRRHAAGHAAASISDDGRVIEDDPDVGPNGGPKHWTDMEKNNLFTWLLCSDEHWDAFKTKMNTVFREASIQLFGGRKSYTALKSCYHRNIETFKQIHAFETFLAKQPPDSESTMCAPGLSPLQSQWDSAMTRQSFLERKLEAARATGIPVGSVNLKVIDHWHKQGWYALFKSRFREDPKTGFPVPFYGPLTAPFSNAQPSDQPASIDPQLMNNDGDGDGDGDGDVEHDDDAVNDRGQGTMSLSCRQSNAGPSTRRPVSQLPLVADCRQQSNIPPVVRAKLPSRTSATSKPQASVPVPGSSRLSPYPHQSYQLQQPADSRIHSSQIEPEAQSAQALDRLTSVVQSLLEACVNLTQLLRAEADEGKAHSQGAREGREGGLNRKEKATLATEMLANVDVGEEVRKAAAEYLKRLFMSE
ncbi:hypothetical protein AcV7_006531 [Taiwanofungus camphoratus]|nr:hypothetical protein AcV7_006531 [Antrodia cinnamomea]